ncbi:MAG: DeoR family transcriptional regulator, partial [Desulfovibrio piger]|nr:DeoR family transcriptional regulator [Desulfovibrio piger]
MTKTTERHQALLHMLNARGYATIDELTKCFSVTPQTIRKDINTLAGQGKVQRFHGGVGMPLSTENILYEQRKKLFLPEKKAIAQMLAKHIPDGASICINLGTTTEEVAYALLGHNNLRVLTNNLNVAAIMARN